jgi:TadE-like protein
VVTKIKRSSTEDGVAMTEFALVLPVFLLVVSGLLAFGRVFVYWIEANHLANETARYAAVDQLPPGAATLQSYARDSGGTLEFGNAKVCITVPGGGTPTIGGPIEVEISKGFSFIPLLEMGTITIRGSSTMRIERLSGQDGTTPSYGFDDPSDPPASYPSAGSPFGECT